MTREVHDADYLDCLPRIYHRSYYLWRSRMLNQIDAIVAALRDHSVDEVREKFNLSVKDLEMLVDLNFITENEARSFGLAGAS